MRAIAACLAVLAASLLAACAAPQPTASAAAAESGQLTEIEAFGSDQVAPRNITLWLPPGYEAGEARYPVLYAQDGQNLFRSGHAYGGQEWGVDETMERLIAAGEIRPAIVVGIWNTPLRYREYGPAGPIDRLPATDRAAVVAAYGGEPLSDAYLRFLTDELKPYVDARYRTLSGPENTVIMGSSMGGLISIYALAERPDVFSAAAALSTHWVTAPTSSDVHVRPDWPETVTTAHADYLRQSRLDPARQRLWTDRGDQTLDAVYPPYHAAMEAVFAELGFAEGERLRSPVFPGTAHDEASWRARLEGPLVFLLGNRDHASPDVDRPEADGAQAQ